jgi:hypothetical protein
MVDLLFAHNRPVIHLGKAFPTRSSFHGRQCNYERCSANLVLEEYAFFGLAEVTGWG